MEKIKRATIFELTLVTGSLLVIARLLYALKFSSFVADHIATIVAVLFLYVPVLVLWKKGRRIDFLDRDLKKLASSFVVFLVTSLIVFPLFFFAAHFWERSVVGHFFFSAAAFPKFSFVAAQILIVSLPEEFYFRGYFQSAMDTVFAKKWRVLGADLGAGWIVTAFIFAIAHMVVYYQWWHFAIFFPALIFGYLRARTGSITAPILFHAASNIIMDWISRSYL